MNEDIDMLIIANDLKQRGRKSVISGKFIFISMSNEYEYVIYPVNENKTLSVKELEEFVDFSNRIKKKGVIAIVDKYGDVTYYLLSEINLGKK
ncbi:ribonuclease BN [Sulfolobus sp. S-194]|uniref:ribonuclease BN n=1 Tax=Sulfolobus sp. S-194 TaxID=2512240 RepID=UPI0014373495|nr:ribonuclease BN [Sulfolobus sp. S-194]QIW23158.1 ribonuclease BN [Sulfolobus sp. S-194]